MTFRLITTKEAVAAYKDRWTDLLGRSRCNRVFSSPELYILNIRFLSGLDPHLILAFDGEEVTGIFPLVKHLKTSEIGFAGSLADYNDLLVAKGDVTTARELVRCLLASATGWSKIVLRQLREDSNCMLGFRALQPAVPLERWRHPGTPCFYQVLDDSFDAFLAGKSKKFHQNLRRSVRLAETAGAEVKQLLPETFPPVELPEVFLALHLERFGGKSTLSEPASQQVIRRLFPVLFQKGSLKAFALYEGEEIAAIDVAMMGDNSFCPWNGGFRASSAFMGPMVLLFAKAFKTAIDMGIPEVDLLRGNNEFKSRWCASQRNTTILEIEPDRN